MKSFHQHIDDDPDTLDEGFLRTASAGLLINHINTKRKQIGRSKKVDAKTLDALASMVLASASLTIAATQFPPETLKGNKRR
tara:strand:+ start:95 stop:340 length:246 start_codon:yes stop_codon:yes gene_type:complete